MPKALTGSERVHYIADAEGNAQAVVVPIDVWTSIQDKIEGPDDWPSPAMRQRLLDSINSPSESRIPFDEVMKRLGLTQKDLDEVG